tara:strand:+ start:378 stop:497 length:120 start_codon:yes stop_codon:yes gene_type:complete
LNNLQDFVDLYAEPDQTLKVGDYTPLYIFEYGGTYAKQK